MYDIAAFAGMLGDPERVRAHVAALEGCLEPGAVVLDLGAGFGFFSLIACQLGAKQVYAVEPADSISLGPELAKVNGFADRITFLRGMSTHLDVPERVDLVLADLRGMLPVHAGSLGSLIDARERWLKPGGTLLPYRDRVWLAPLDDLASHTAHCRPFERHARGLDFSTVTTMLANRVHAGAISPRSFLSPPTLLWTLEYASISSERLRAEVVLDLAQAGTVHGLAIWFDAEVAPGISYSAVPGRPGNAHGHGFLPLVEPVTVARHDQLVVRARVDGSPDYAITWELEQRRGGRTLGKSQQSEFFGAPTPLEALKKNRPDHTPALSREGEVELFILQRLGRETNEQLAEALRQQFSHYRDQDKAFARVTAAVRRFGR